MVQGLARLHAIGYAVVFASEHQARIEIFTLLLNGKTPLEPFPLPDPSWSGSRRKTLWKGAEELEKSDEAEVFDRRYQHALLAAQIRNLAPAPRRYRHRAFQVRVW